MKYCSLVAIAVSVLLAACSPSPSKMIIGTWKEINGQGGIQFLGDGSALFYGPGVQTTISWSMPEEGILRLAPASGTAGLIVNNKMQFLDQDTLKLELIFDGSTQILKRVKE